MVRMGIIGTGFIAHEHIKAAMSIDDCCVCAIANRTLHKAVDFGKKYGIYERNIYGNYIEMLDCEHPDAVIINLPHYLHKDAFIECAIRKIDVLMEKPMAIDSKSCRIMNEYAGKYGVRLMVGHTQRYNRKYSEAKKIIDSGSLGKLIMVRDTIHYNYFWDGRPEWQLSPELSGGGIMMNYGVHTFDRLQFLSGCDVERLYAHIDLEKDGFRIDSSYQVQADLTGGVSASTICTGYTGPFVNQTDMIFKNGILRVVLVKNNMNEDGIWLGNNEHDFQKIPVIDENMYKAQLSDFIRYLKGECQSPIDGRYGERILKQVEACYLSNNTKQTVELK